MHSLSLRDLTTLLCQDLLANPGDTDLAHCTINLPLHTVSAVFRVAYDGSYFSTIFTLTQTHCLGAIVMEVDGAYWTEPAMSSWTSLAEYQAAFSVPPDPAIATFRSPEEYREHFPGKAQPEPVPWSSLLESFSSVNIVRQHPVKDVLDVLSGSGRELCEQHDIETLLLDLE